MKKSILSIDFDYFQDVPDPSAFQSYPDGIDLPTELSTIVWASKYSFDQDADRILSVKPLENELKILKGILLNQDPDTKIMIRNSHLEIYNWIHELIPNGQPFCLRNVDMHHDLFNGNSFVDCGNWVDQVFRDYGRKSVDFKWIPNPISLKMYGFEEYEISDLLIDTLQDISTEKYDYIFLCRSDNWFPPHLDDSFIDILTVIKSHFAEDSVDAKIGYRDYKAIASEIKRAVLRRRKTVKKE